LLDFALNCVGQLVAVYNSPHILLEYPDGNRLQLVVLHFAAEPVGWELTAEEMDRLDAVSAIGEGYPYRMIRKYGTR